MTQHLSEIASRWQKCKKVDPVTLDLLVQRRGQDSNLRPKRLLVHSLPARMQESLTPKGIDSQYWMMQYPF